MSSSSSLQFFPFSKPTQAGRYKTCFKVQHPVFSRCRLQNGRAALQGFLQQLHSADASFHLEAIPAGWQTKHRLALLGVQGFHCKTKGLARQLPHLTGHSHTKLHWHRVSRYLIGCTSRTTCYLLVEHSIAPTLLLQCLQQRPGHKFSIHLTPRQHLYPTPRTALQCLLNSNHICATQSPSVWKPSTVPSRPQETLQPQAATTPPATPSSSSHRVIKPMLGLRWLLAVLELKKMTAWDTVSTRPWRVTYPFLCRSSQPNSQASIPTTDCPLRHMCRRPAQLARHPRSVLMLKTSGLYMQCVFKDHSVETKPDQETGDR
jgi:hypothetical protein